MAHRTLVLDIVGLTDRMIDPHLTPNLCALRDGGRLVTLAPVFPAVTCSVQSTMLTGATPREHGVVGNGWYDRESAEVRFWKQSNHLVGGEKVWETARRHDPSVTTANLFWWFNMYASVDWSITPRPIYKADGRKVPDVYSDPPELRDETQLALGRFPLFRFWGPAASIEASRWIAESALYVAEQHDPTLTFVYLPHLDYPLQKVGPDHASIADEVRAVDTVAGTLIDRWIAEDGRVLVVSEYAIEKATQPIHPNRVLRDAGFVRVRVEEGLELLDAGGSRAFAVADHQVAHVYVRDEDDVAAVAACLAGLPGVDRVFDRAAQAEVGLDHDRAGDLVVVAAAGHWFTYYYWHDDERAPDFARTVDIHRKPGYDPVELFIDPDIGSPKLAVAIRLLRKKLGFRTLMNVIPLDSTLVRGTHGRTSTTEHPVMIGTHLPNDVTGEVPCARVRDAILATLFDG